MLIFGLNAFKLMTLDLNVFSYFFLSLKTSMASAHFLCIQPKSSNRTCIIALSKTSPAGVTSKSLDGCVL